MSSCDWQPLKNKNIARIANAIQSKSHSLTVTLNVMIKVLNLWGMVNCVNKSLYRSFFVFVWWKRKSWRVWTICKRTFVLLKYRLFKRPSIISFIYLYSFWRHDQPWEYRIEYRSKAEISNLFTVLIIESSILSIIDAIESLPPAPPYLETICQKECLK